jgi:hypothetical protein
MKIRHALMSFGVASALAAAPAFAQTTIVVDPQARVDPGAPIVVLTPDNTYVANADNATSGMHYEVDRIRPTHPGRRHYGTSPAPKSQHLRLVGRPRYGYGHRTGYMGPRDTSGQ